MDERIGIKQVAEKAGVSASTVSRVLSGNVAVSPETAKIVLDAVKQLDYHPNPVAQSLKGGKLKTIGLLIPNVRNLVFPAAIRGIEDTAQKYGYTLVLCNTDENAEKEQAYIQNLRRRLIDGFIVSTAHTGTEHIWNELNRQSPVVFLIRHFSHSADAVVLDNFDGAYQATSYLAQRGHKKIAIINGSLDILLYQERFRGYLKALEDAQIPVYQEMIRHRVNGWDDSYLAMQEILKEAVCPDAVFATNDPKAIGAIKAIKDAGLSIPGDISVMGFDNSDIAPMLDPSLTTVSQPFYEMGARACEKLIRLIEKKRRIGNKIEILPAELVIRDSVR
jgi:LacI family transcriptional regulator